ncbi:MAG: FkbM family methyltransferase, partial [Verrucomicrobiae bacterium]|nr:FkbM family methyltransferase [Verrucomicrobiae bacterium]
DRTGSLKFRTAGAAGYLENVPCEVHRYPCFETVPVIRLDDWVERTRPGGVDLLKMDIEGAEIEALEGAREMLRRYRPVCLIQAYHIREGARTFEQCAMILKECGYSIREVPEGSGLLIGRPC